MSMGKNDSVSELKRINVMVPEEIHRVLDEFKKNHSYASKDKALAELLREFKRIGGK